MVGQTIINRFSFIQASYLSQMGGHNTPDFLKRCLPQLLQDELCQLTNWSGSAIPAGSFDLVGSPITREFKKTFRNLTHIVSMLCGRCL